MVCCAIGRLGVLYKYCQQCSHQYSSDMLNDGKTTGRDAGAVLVIRALAQSVIGGPAASKPSSKSANVDRVMNLLFAPGCPSLTDMAARLLRDCHANGFAENIRSAADDLRRQADSNIESARTIFVLGHPEMVLPMYYTGLFMSVLYTHAAHLMYEGLSCAPMMDAGERKWFSRMANAIEEKLVRISNALKYAISDVDGSQLHNYRTIVRTFLASNQSDKAEARVMELIDLHVIFIHLLFAQSFWGHQSSAAITFECTRNCCNITTLCCAREVTPATTGFVPCRPRRGGASPVSDLRKA